MTPFKRTGMLRKRLSSGNLDCVIVVSPRLYSTAAGRAAGSVAVAAGLVAVAAGAVAVGWAVGWAVGAAGSGVLGAGGRLHNRGRASDQQEQELANREAEFS